MQKVNFAYVLRYIYLYFSGYYPDISHIILNHVIMLAKFGHFRFHLDSYYISGKVAEFQRVSSKALRRMVKSLGAGVGSQGPPGPSRVKMQFVFETNNRLKIFKMKTMYETA